MNKKLLTLLALFVYLAHARAQNLTLPPSGGNQKASVTQYMGLVSVTITYNSPDVHAPDGTDRKGKIWGELVHTGFIDQNFGTSKAAPWRAGANENTTVTFSHDVLVNGKPIRAGTYGLFLAYEKDGASTWIFSNNSTSWGSYFYDPKEDALRVQTTAEDAPYTEWLTFDFANRALSSAVAYLQWENKRFPFTVSVPNIHALYVDKLREELRSSKGFNYQSWASAAQYCAQNKINLEEALTWADYAINGTFIGQENFTTLQTKSVVLDALGRNAEAEQVMTKAIHLPTATVQEIHQYGRMLLAAGKKEKAMDVFKLNRQKHPEDTFTTYVGLARGYTALGDKKNAIRNWEIAIRNLPENQKQNKAVYESELNKLKS